MISITDLQDILRSKSGGKPLSKVANFFALCYEAMLEVKANVDLPSAIRTVQLTNPVYSSIDSYPLPSDVSLDSIILIRPIVPDTTYIDFTALNGRQMRVEEKFSTTSKRYGMRVINGVQSLLIQDVTTTPLVILNCDSLTANGAITAVGVTTNVQLDTLQRIAGSGSISFDVGVGTSNGIQDTGMTPVDLTNQKDILYYAYIPSMTGVTGLRLSLGQGAGNYYQGSVTTDFFGNALVAGWNLIRLPKTSMAVGAGAPTWSGVIYMKYEVLGTFAATSPGFRLDCLVGQVGALYEIDYYSDLQFQDITGARIAKPTANTDSIIIQGDEINLYLGELISMMTTDLKQAGVGVDQNKYGNRIFSRRGIAFDRYEDFKMKHPSQRQLAVTKLGQHPSAFINQ